LSNRTILLGLALTFAACCGASADSGGSFDFESHGARDLALAGAAQLHDAGLEALFLQPASLTSVSGPLMGLFIQRYGGGLALEQGTVALAYGSGERIPLDRRFKSDSEIAVGAAFQYRGATLADESSWGEWSLSATAAWSPMRWFSVGGRASYSAGGSQDGMDRGRATAMDLGLRLRFLRPGLETGVLMKDFYHRFSWIGGGDYRRDPTTVLSLGWAGLEIPRLPGAWRIEGRSSLHRSSVESYGSGLEWRLLDGIAILRGGLMAWRQGESRNYPTFGFGFRAGSFQVDYGFSPDVAAGMTSRHRISLTRYGS